MPGLSRVLLWLFAIDLGIAFGAGLYEARISFPDWLVTAAGSEAHWDAAAARLADTGRRFWVFVTTVPLTLLCVANAIAAWRAVGPERGFWLAAAVLALIERVVTFSYFIPTMVQLVDAPDSAESVATATRWASRNYLRHALVLAAWLASLKALSSSPARRAAT